MIWIPCLLNTGGSDPIRRLSQPNPRYAGVPKAHEQLFNPSLVLERPKNLDT
jgi:hypothetical protein